MQERLKEVVITPEELKSLMDANLKEMASRNMFNNVRSEMNEQWYLQCYNLFNQEWDKLIAKYWPDIDRSKFEAHADFTDSMIYLTKI